MPPDYPALVIGCGALGQFGVKILRLLSGADISPSRGFGVSAAFDFVGPENTLALALGTTRPAGRLVQVGLVGGTAHLTALRR